MVSLFVWKKRNGAFFRLVKCTTSRPPWQAATGGTRHGQTYQEAVKTSGGRCYVHLTEKDVARLTRVHHLEILDLAEAPRECWTLGLGPQRWHYVRLSPTPSHNQRRPPDRGARAPGHEGRDGESRHADAPSDAEARAA